MVIACPGCAARLNVSEETGAKSEQKVLCPGCKRVFLMKEGVRAAAIAAPAAAPAAARVPPPAVPPPASPPVTARRAGGAPAPAHAPPTPAAEAKRVPPPQASPASPAPPASPAKGFDPLATRRMTAADFQQKAPDADAATDVPITFEEAIAGALPPEEGAVRDGWEVDRADYQGTVFSMDELKDLIKRGWLERTDGVRHAGGGSFIEAGDHPTLAKAFSLRQKMDAQKIQAAVSKSAALPCANHPKNRAVFRCDRCAKVFCDHCGNETEIRQKTVFLCPVCDQPLARL